MTKAVAKKLAAPNAGRPVAPDGWSDRGGKLNRTFKLAAYTDVLVLVAAVGMAALKLDHHPQMVVGERFLAVTIWTRDAQGKKAGEVSDKDRALALAINEAAAAG